MPSAIAKQRIEDTTDSLIGSGYRQIVTDSLKQMLTTAVTSGMSYNDMLDQIQTALLGAEDKPGMISKYAKTYVTDTLGQFAGQGNKLIATALDSQWFQYVGSNLTTTREFCEHLTKKRYVHISEIPTILKGEIDGHKCKINEATGLWLGAKDGTNEDNFIVNRGGWNCGHELIPVNEAVVPRAVRDRILGTDLPQKVKWASEHSASIGNMDKIISKLGVKESDVVGLVKKHIIDGEWEDQRTGLVNAIEGAIKNNIDEALSNEKKRLKNDKIDLSQIDLSQYGSIVKIDAKDASKCNVDKRKLGFIVDGIFDWQDFQVERKLNKLLGIN